jgi:hypothetical protein
MARVEELLELLNTLILSSVDNTVTIDKTTLQSVVTCLQVSQAKVTLLQTQTRLLHDALERKNLRQHYELVLVQNPIFEDDEDDDAMIQTNNQHKSNSVRQLQIQVQMKSTSSFQANHQTLGRNQAQQAQNRYQI